ncbi:TonB-dependent receptor [Membranihabitans marinus]
MITYHGMALPDINSKLKFEEKFLIEVLDEISREHNVYFTYDSDMVSGVKVDYQKIEGESVRSLLSRLLKEVNFDFKIFEERFVIIYKNSKEGIQSLEQMIRHMEGIVSEKKDAAKRTEAKVDKLKFDNAKSLFIKRLVINISGQIQNEEGEPLIGVNVLVKGTDKGTATDIEGNFALEDVDENAVLIVSYIGYQTQEIALNGRRNFTITLLEDAQTLDELVVVGMGEQRKASVIGAISNVNMDDLKIPNRSLTNALAGRMAGAVVVQRSGELGNDNGGFWIRGISTFSSNRSPLILVDGVERDMQNLNPENIESLSILKDASATAVYGVRAANGVVLVTTRKGVKQKPTIEFKTEYGISDLPKLPDYLGGVDYAKLYNEALGRDNYSEDYISNLSNQSDPYLYPNVDWFDETYTKYSSNTQSTLNVRGGGDVARYFVGLGFLGENGNFRNSGENSYNSNLSLNRYNFRSNVDITLSKSTVVDLEVGGHLTDLHTPGLGGNIYGTNYSPAGELFYWSNLATPISNSVRIPLGIDANGNEIYGWGAPSQVGEKNPAERLLGSGYNTQYSNQVMSQITLNQELNAIAEGLKLRTSFSFDAYNLTSIQRRKQSTTYGVQGRDPNTGDLLYNEVDQGQEFLNYSRALESNRAKEFKFQLIYSKKMSNKHRIGGMAMYYHRDYINGNASSSILALPYRRQGIAGRMTYDYNDRYFGEINVGYNGSENFPKGNRFGVFPAIAAGWLVSNESFWSGNLKRIINVLKLKGSYGLVGSEALPGGERYGYLSIYGAGLGGYSFGETSRYFGGVGLDRIGVQDLTWEKGIKKNVGFEMLMFNGDVSLEVDYFHERRYDILLQRTSLPGIVGINSVPFANFGEMINRGLDGTLELTRDFNDGFVRVYGNFTYARDRIIEQDEPNRNYDYRNRTGHKYGQNFGLISLGYFIDENDIENSPLQTFGEVRPGDVKYKDINGDGLITIDDEVPIGYSNLPEINYGFGVQTMYKNFDVGVFFRGQGRVSYGLGGAYIPFNQGVGKGNLFVQALDRWTVENPSQDAQYPRLYNGTSANNWQRSTKTIYDGSFLRLSNVELGYTLSGDKLAKIGLERLRFYLIGNNIAVFSKWKMWDPETGTASGSNYPLQRKFNFGIRGTF